MPGSEGGKTADRKRPLAVMWIIALFFGLFGFYTMTQRPQFESYRTVDVVQLLASGAGFGVALVGLALWLVRPRLTRGRIGQDEEGPYAPERTSTS